MSHLDPINPLTAQISRVRVMTTQFPVPLIDEDFPLWFGKYKGKLLGKIIKEDPKYVSWCLDKNIFKVHGYLEDHIDELVIEQRMNDEHNYNISCDWWYSNN